MPSRPPARRDTEAVICAEILRVLREQGKDAVEVSLEHALNAELGLSSSDVVGLVSVLNAKLQVDPFNQLVAVTDVSTVGDLCRVYEKALGGAARPRAATDELRASQERARARRARPED